jgi:hypothetical protein
MRSASEEGAAEAGQGEGARLEEVLRRVREALRGLGHGSVTLTVHEGHVVQVDRVEKVRLPVPLKARAGG